jgi:DNA helicase-2/ATP-dependent DNA helicase PcrA
MIPKTATTGKVSVTEFRSLEDEAEKIAQALLKMGNYNNTAIIYRMNSRSLYFEQIFSKYRIPYKVVNELPFFQRRVCKDLLSALAASNNPEDRSSLARVINTPKRGFGDVKKIKLMEQGRAYLTENMNDLPLIKPFIKLLDDIKGMPPARALAEYLNRSGYWDTVDKDSDRYMIKALQDVVVAFPTVEELILASTFLEKDSGDGVNLITAHGSKGLEYDRVFVVGLEEGVWPHKSAEDLDEERRLYYVACTRAKKYLNLSYSKARNFRGTLLSNSPSQLFLDSYNHLHP